MNDSTRQLMMVLDMRASNRVKARVAERVQNGLCLGETDDGNQCECKARTRGLCERCHYRWRMLKLRMSDTDAALFDAKLIRCGRLLSQNGARQYRKKSVFHKLSKEAS